MKKTAHLISSGFKVPKKDLEETIAYWKECGLDFIHDPHLLKDHSSDLLCSENLVTRFEEFKVAFESDQSNLVWSLRGGYGAHQLLPLLRDVSFQKQKLYMGFSDGSSIHYYLNQHLNWPSLHSPHPNTFHKGIHSESVVAVVKSLVLEDQNISFEFKNLSLLNSSKVEVIETEIVGGNLTTLVSLLGTEFNKGASGKTLFLEEVDEPAYKVIRHLHHMSQAGFFDGVKALVFGHMTHSNKNQEELILKTIKEWSENMGFPVLWGLNSGHRHEQNHPLWFLKKSKLVLDEKPHLLNNIV